MSADNGYVIRKHPDGGYTPVMYFASDERPYRDPTPERDISYATPWAAYLAVRDDYTEYGICFESGPRLRDAPGGRTADGQAAWARTVLGMSDDEPNEATGHDTREAFERLVTTAPEF